MYKNSDKRYKSRIGVNLTTFISVLCIDKSIVAEDNFNGFKTYKKLQQKYFLAGQARISKLLW